MNTSFGLGLVLNFTDKASGGISAVVGAFNTFDDAVDKSGAKVEEFSRAVSGLGTALSASITAPISKLTQTLLNYGLGRASFIENSQIAFSTILGDVESASNYLSELLDFARTTPFSYEALTGAAQRMLSFGIETEKVIPILRTLGDTAGSLGKGSEFVEQTSLYLSQIQSLGKATGIQIRSLELQGIQVGKILGNIYGKTEEQAKEYAKTISSTQFIDDLTRGLREGTEGINGMTAAVDGLSEKLKGTFTGAKDSFTAGLKNAGLELLREYTDEFGQRKFLGLEQLTTSLRNLTQIVKNLTPILQPLVDGFFYLTLSASNLAFRVSEVYANLSQPIQRTIGIFTALLTILGPILLITGRLLPAFAKLATGGLGLAGAVKALTTGFAGLLIQFAPLIALSYLLYKAWTNDFGGIATYLTVWFKNIGKTFRLLKEAFSDNTLSYTSFDEARRLGILPLIEAVLNLKYTWGLFVQGFKDGFNSVFESFITLGKQIGFIKKDITDLSSFVSETLGKIVGPQFFEQWSTVGEVFGKIAAIGIVLLPVIKVVTIVIGLITKLAPIISTIVSGIAALNPVVLAVTAGVLLLIALFKNFDSFRDTIVGIARVFVSLWKGRIIPIIEALIQAFQWVIVIVKQLWFDVLEPIISHLLNALRKLWNTTLKPMLALIGNLIGSISEFILALWNVVLAPFISWVISSFGPPFVKIITEIVSVALWLGEALGGTINGILLVLSGLIDFLTGVFTSDWRKAWQGIKQIFGGVWTAMTAAAKAAVNGIIWVVNKLLKAIHTGITGLFNGPLGAVSKIANDLGFDIDLTFDFRPANQIPYLEEGGLVTKPTVAVVGEGDDNEAVLPLNDSVFAKLAQGINSANSGNDKAPVTEYYSNDTYNIKIESNAQNLDNMELERIVDKLMKIIERKKKLNKLAIRNPIGVV